MSTKVSLRILMVSLGFVCLLQVQLGCGISCPANQVACGTTCVDNNTDAAHCGACNTACEAGEGCSAGKCEPECASDQDNCGGNCVNTKTNAGHCGACDNACAFGELCTAGKCDLNCAASETRCGDECVYIGLSTDHCGACGNKCKDGEVCNDGKCGPPCPSGTEECAGACSDTQSDSKNCGSCGKACGADEVCNTGKCEAGCSNDTTKCGEACVDTKTSTAHCGACDTACKAGEVCNAGKCELTIATMCQQTSEARCKPLFLCCQGLSLAFTDLQDCQTKFAAQCVQGAQKEKEGLEAGHIIIHSQSLRDCVAAIETAGLQCQQAEVVNLERVCGGVFQDKAALTQPCASKLTGLTCANGAGRCLMSSGALLCNAWRAEGELCNPLPCEAGLNCLADPTASDKEARCRKPGGEKAYCLRPSDCAKGLTCLSDQRCGTPLVEGATCTGPGQCAPLLACHLGMQKCVKRVLKGESCEAHPECIAKHLCLGLQRIGRCQKQGAKDAPCQNDTQCATTLRCSSTSNTCILRAKEGEACNSGAECDVGLGCDTTGGKCVTLPTEGKSCLLGVRECADTLSCFSPKKGEGICKKPVPLGEVCTKDTNCQSGLGCDSASGKCVKQPTAGGKCLNGHLCLDSYCDLKIGDCKAYHKVGDACVAGNECGPQGACVQSGPKTLVCASIPKEGDECLLTCASGLFCELGLKKGSCYADVCGLAAQ